MWILTSLSRPQRIRAVVESYDWGNERVILALYDQDKCLRDYFVQQWPDTWLIKTVPMLGNGPTYNEILKRYPNERCYGFLADDAILNEQGMLRVLEEAADDWFIAYANDQHWGDRIPTMPCMGGKLVSANRGSVSHASGSRIRVIPRRAIVTARVTVHAIGSAGRRVVAASRMEYAIRGSGQSGGPSARRLCSYSV